MWRSKLGLKIRADLNTLQQENRRSFPRNAETKRNLAIITDREFGERVGIYRMLEVIPERKNPHELFSLPALPWKTIRRFSKTSAQVWP